MKQMYHHIYVLWIQFNDKYSTHTHTCSHSLPKCFLYAAHVALRDVRVCVCVCVRVENVQNFTWKCVVQQFLKLNSLYITCDFRWKIWALRHHLPSSSFIFHCWLFVDAVCAFAFDADFVLRFDSFSPAVDLCSFFFSFSLLLNFI